MYALLEGLISGVYPAITSLRSSLPAKSQIGADGFVNSSNNSHREHPQDAPLVHRPTGCDELGGARSGRWSYHNSLWCK